MSEKLKFRPDVTVSGFDAFAKQSLDEAANSIEDRTTRELFKARETQRAQTTRIRVWQAEHNARVNGMRADLNGTLDDYAESAIMAPTDDAMRSMLNDGFNALDTARGTDVISDIERQDMRDKLQERVTRGYAGRLVDTNPTRLLDIDTDPAFGGMSPEARLIYRQKAQAQLDRREREAEAELAKTHARQISDLEIAVTRGEAGLPEIEEAYQDGWLGPAKRTTLTKTADTLAAKLAENHAEVGRVAVAMQTGVPLDPGSAQDRRAVDEHFSQVLAPILAETPPERVPEAVTGYVAKTGVVPSHLKAAWTGYLRGTDPQRKAQAADIIARLDEINPRLLDNFSKSDRRTATMIAQQLRIGATPTQAAERAEAAIHGADDPARKVRAQRLREEGFLNLSAVESKVSDALAEPAFWSLDFGDAEMPDAILGEYRAAYEAHFLATGDEDVAERLAVSDLKATWAVTRVGGERRLMKYAPERYGIVSMSEKANAEWMNEQLDTDLTALGLPTENIRIEVDPLTARQERPSYLVLRQRDDGAFDTLMKDGKPLRWHPDWTASPKRQAIVDELDAEVETARAKRAAIANGNFSAQRKAARHGGR